jgi:hypothetical protein
MSYECPWCHALLLKSELGDRKAPWGFCCNNGKVKLAAYSPPPEYLHKLWTDQNPEAKAFRANIRKYNNAFSLTSIGANEFLFKRRMGTDQYRINGSMSHKIGSVRPRANDAPKFLSLYFVCGEEEAIQYRRGNLGQNQELSPIICGNLHRLLANHHSFLKKYRTLLEEANHEVVGGHNRDEVTVVLVAPGAGDDKRTHNLPSVLEVGAVIPDGGLEPINNQREIVVKIGSAQENFSFFALNKVCQKLRFRSSTHSARTNTRTIAKQSRILRT